MISTCFSSSLVSRISIGEDVLSETRLFLDLDCELEKGRFEETIESELLDDMSMTDFLFVVLEALSEEMSITIGFPRAPLTV